MSASPRVARACRLAARHCLLRVPILLPVMGACASLGACGDAADPHIPAVVRTAQPQDAAATTPQLSTNVNTPARDGLAPPVMHTVD